MSLEWLMLIFHDVLHLCVTWWFLPYFLLLICHGGYQSIVNLNGWIADGVDWELFLVYYIGNLWFLSRPRGERVLHHLGICFDDAIRINSMYLPYFLGISSTSISKVSSSVKTPFQFDFFSSKYILNAAD